MAAAKKAKIPDPTLRDQVRVLQKLLTSDKKELAGILINLLETISKYDQLLADKDETIDRKQEEIKKLLTRVIEAENRNSSVSISRMEAEVEVLRRRLAAAVQEKKRVRCVYMRGA